MNRKNNKNNVAHLNKKSIIPQGLWIRLQRSWSQSVGVLDRQPTKGSTRGR
jgi:hypothetical protein